MLRDINGVDFHFDFLDPARDKFPEGGCSVRIGDSHVHQGLDRIAHGVEHEGGTLDVSAGQAVITEPGEWIRYSTPDGAEYVAGCLPAFAAETVHRDAEDA